MTRAVIYCRCSTEEECQKDALIRQAAEARECVRRLNWSLEDEYIESRSGTSTRGTGTVPAAFFLTFLEINLRLW